MKTPILKSLVLAVVSLVIPGMATQRHQERQGETGATSSSHAAIW